MKRRAEGQAMPRPEGPAPLCPCHSEPMYWHKEPCRKNGGRWRCAVKQRERDRKRRAEGQAMPRPEGPAPLCPCHSEPMYWHKDAGHKNGGRWRCAVKQREHNREHRKQPHLCDVRGCTEPAMQYSTGNYANYCAAHKREHRQRPHKCNRRGCTRMAVVWTTGYVDSFCWLHKERHDAHTHLNRLEKQWAAAEGRPWPPPVAEPDRSTSITWETRPVPPLPPPTRLSFHVVRRWPISDTVEQGKEE